jgi:hypothetical protein
MADDIRVSPTPIQRNVKDVALELTLLYYQNNNTDSIEEIQETYAKFYAIAETLRRSHYKEFGGLLPNSIKEML